MTCEWCDRQTRHSTQSIDDFPGTVIRATTGLCSRCYLRGRKDGRIQKKPKAVPKLKVPTLRAPKAPKVHKPRAGKCRAHPSRTVEIEVCRWTSRGYELFGGRLVTLTRHSYVLICEGEEMTFPRPEWMEVRQ